MGIGELSGKSDEMAGVALQWTAFLSRERRGGGGGESNSAFSFFILWEPG